MEKLRTLPPVQHQPQTIETQPSTNPNAILVFCTGNILVEQGKPLKYSEVFQLVASAPGQYYLPKVLTALAHRTQNLRTLRTIVLATSCRTCRLALK